MNPKGWLPKSLVGIGLAELGRWGTSEARSTQGHETWLGRDQKRRLHRLSSKSQKAVSASGSQLEEDMPSQSHALDVQRNRRRWTMFCATTCRLSPGALFAIFCKRAFRARTMCAPTLLRNKKESARERLAYTCSSREPPLYYGSTRRLALVATMRCPSKPGQLHCREIRL